MVKSPCYDEKNQLDCPRRKWCLENGRGNCEKWVAYKQRLDDDKLMIKEAKDRDNLTQVSRRRKYNYNRRVVTYEL